MAHKVWGGRHLTEEEIEFFLKEVNTARFCSHNNDETIHAAPVWFKYENGKIVILSPEHSRKSRNVKQNKNVSILIDVEKPPRGVLIYGKAELNSEFDLESTAMWLCEKYMLKEKAKDHWRSVTPPTTNWLKITVKPERMASFDYS
ncbi:MAG: pyridoxamine 5'-phosphate oxidase family protein [Candidatus Bathyarchaeota archaeon]|nr:pyridoxamine 5'-phosphate oxidase family protein [Candidatus Bathyarchaeota archaeon]